MSLKKDDLAEEENNEQKDKVTADETEALKNEVCK